MKVNVQWSLAFCFKTSRRFTSHFIGVFLVFVITCAPALALDTIQSTAHITISLKNVPLKAVFESIEEQAGVSLMYDMAVVNDQEIVSIHIRDADVKAVLEELFREKLLQWSIRGNVVRIIRKPTVKPIPKIEQRMGSLMLQNRGKPDVAVDTLYGTITDRQGLPLIGVNIVVKGTAKGSATDFEGHFSLLDIKQEDVLVVSYVGYQTIEVPVEGQRFLAITMLEDSQTLDEVVVVGYGTKKKVNLTGAVDVIDSRQLENRQSATISQLLQGQSPGLNFSVGNNGFQPGAQMSIDIRGIGSINGGAPLIVIDGIPGDLDRVNPEDIESISILKDAASSAIYGARAPYGVIMVTTKSGSKNSRFTATYSGNLMVNTPSNLPRQVDSYTYARVMNEAGDNGGGRPYTNEGIDRILAYQRGDFDYIRQLMPESIRDKVTHFETIPDPNNPNVWLRTTNSHANNDFFDIWYGHSINQKHNFSFQGGSDKTSYYFSAGLYEQEGVLNFGEDMFDRINVLAKINTSITDWWDFSYEPRIIKTNRVRPSNQNGDYSIVFHQIARTYPTNPVYNGFGDYNIQSKIPWTEEAGTDDTEETINWHKFATEFKPLKGWSIIANLSYRSISEFRSSKRLTVFEYLVDGTPLATSNTVPSSIRQFHVDENYWTSNIYSSYDLDLQEKHHFHILAGTQFESTKGRYLNTLKTNLLQPLVPSLQTASGEPTSTESLTHWTTQGVFGRLSYHFDERYLAEANVRYDGSSVFKPGHQWGFFPSFSMGWNVNKENFWKPIEKYVNTLKFRWSWGKLGNQNIAPYSDLDLIPLLSSPVNWVFNYGGTRPIGYTATPGLVSSDLTWETATTMNFGVDMSFLDGRLQTEFNWFERLTTDMIGASEASPGVLGTNVPMSNNSTLQTKGWELALNWQQHIGNHFNYYVRFNLYDNVSRITQYFNPTRSLTTWYEGMTYGEIWGYTADQLFQTQEELDNYRDQVDLSQISNTWNPGDVKYEDINGDGVISQGSNTRDDPGDLSIIGNSTPRFQYGVMAGLSFKGLDFSILMKGVGKRDVWMEWSWFNYWGIRSTVHNVVKPGHLDYFRDSPGDQYMGLYEGQDNINMDSYWPKPYTNDAQNRRNRQVSDRYLADLSYLRIQNISLGYTLPRRITSSLRLQNVRMYLSAENLKTWDNLPVKGIDPIAYAGASGGGSTYGADIITSFGLKITY